MTSLGCDEVRKRLDVFLDGETDGRTMRVIALHIARCDPCEQALRREERLQEIVARAVEAEVDAVDVPALWKRIETGLGPLEVPGWMRLRDRWEAWSGSSFRAPVLAMAAAAVAAVLLGVWSSGESGRSEARVANNEARIERLASSEPNVVVWSEPEERTTAIWVTSYEP